MPFKTLLNALVENVPGAQGAIIADWEGESVEQVGIMDDYDLKVIGAHKGVILHNMREVVDRLGDGDPRDCHNHPAATNPDPARDRRVLSGVGHRPFRYAGSCAAGSPTLYTGTAQRNCLKTAVKH
jgi:hypothetical protein